MISSSELVQNMDKVLTNMIIEDFELGLLIKDSKIDLENDSMIIYYEVQRLSRDDESIDKIFRARKVELILLIKTIVGYDSNPNIIIRYKIID